MIRHRIAFAVTGSASILFLCLWYAPVQSQSSDPEAPAAAKPAKRGGEGKQRHAKPESGSPAGDAASATVPDKPAAPPPQPVAAAPSVGRICTLSRDTITNSSAVNVSINQRLDQLRQGAQAEINDAATKLQADTKALDADKRPPSDEGLKKAREELAGRGRALAQRTDLLSRELDATRQTINVQFQNAAAPLIQAVERQQGCTLLLARESVLDGGSAIDVTPLVLAAMNDQLHPQPFGLVTLAANPAK